jgi:hypothetical protein
VRLRLHGRKWEWASAKWECDACIAISRTPPLVLVRVKVEVNIAPEELESMDMDKIKAKYQEAQGAHPLTLGGAVVLHSRPDPVCIASHRIGMALRCVAQHRKALPIIFGSSHALQRIAPTALHTVGRSMQGSLQHTHCEGGNAE